MMKKTFRYLFPLFLAGALFGQKTGSTVKSGSRPAPKTPAPKTPAKKKVAQKKATKSQPQPGPRSKPSLSPKVGQGRKLGSQPSSRPSRAGMTSKPGIKGDPKKAKREKGKKGSSKAGQKVGIKIEGKLVDPGQKKVPIPDGASEGDIRAIRGANAMLSAEKKLPKILKKMKIKGGVPFLPFDKIDAWPYEDGFKGMPKALKKWDKKRVVMAGFMFPIDEVEDIHEFFLVKSLWSCCYGTPPDVNGLVKVVIKAKKGIPYYYDPILIIGTFHLKKVLDEDFCVAIYEMDAEVVKVLDL